MSQKGMWASVPTSGAYEGSISCYLGWHLNRVLFSRGLGQVTVLHAIQSLWPRCFRGSVAEDLFFRLTDFEVWGLRKCPILKIRLVLHALKSLGFEFGKLECSCLGLELEANP